MILDLVQITEIRFKPFLILSICSLSKDEDAAPGTAESADVLPQGVQSAAMGS